MGFIYAFLHGLCILLGFLNLDFAHIKKDFMTMCAKKNHSCMFLALYKKAFFLTFLCTKKKKQKHYYSCISKHFFGIFTKT